MIADQAAIAAEIAARRLNMLVEQYVENRRRRHDFISVAKAQAAILRLFPEAADKTDALGRMIIECAVAHALAVHFDGSAGEQTYELVERSISSNRNAPNAEVPVRIS